MLVPAPPPTYSLSPALRPLRPDEQSLLDEGIAALTGVVMSALVTGVGRTMGRPVLELATSRGTVLVMEGRHPVPGAAPPHPPGP